MAAIIIYSELLFLHISFHCGSAVKWVPPPAGGGRLRPQLVGGKGRVKRPESRGGLVN